MYTSFIDDVIINSIFEDDIIAIFSRWRNDDVFFVIIWVIICEMKKEKN